MTSRLYDVSPMIGAMRAAGGWNALARSSGINRGTLKYIGEGKRSPSRQMAKKLIKMGLINAIERKPIVPWKRIAMSLLCGPNHLIGVLVTLGVDRDVAQSIAEREFA